MITRRSWCDGLFYALFIASTNSIIRRKIVKYVERGTTVHDPACGTGGLALDLANKAK